MAELLPLASTSGMAGAAGTPSSLPPAPSPSELRDWYQETYDLDRSVAASLGFAVGQASASMSSRVLIFESSRSKDVDSDGHTYRYGVALRVVVEVEEIKGTGGLTLPVVAAKVELEGARATSRLSVRGYRGDDLAGLLPNWTSFGVDQYAGYMKTVSELQAKIMANAQAIDPELLSTTAIQPAAAAPSVARSVAMVYGLDALAHGLTLEDALRRLPQLDDDVIEIVRATYRDRVGGDDRTRPDQEQSSQAKRDLGGLSLRHGIFI